MSLDKPTLDDLRIDRTQARRSKAPLLLVLVLLLVALIAGGAVWWMKRPKAVPVRTMLIAQSGGSGQRTLLNAAGYVTARRKATVSAKVTGKVTEILVEEGMKVEAGQVLARLDSSNIEKSLRLSQAQAESARKALEETRANLKTAERELARITQLASDKISSQSDLDRADAEAKSLQARLDRQLADVRVAESEVALWNQQLDDMVIRAPFGGIVTSKDAQPGEMVSPISAGSGFTRTGICTIVDMTSLEIEVDVNESYINRVSAGQPVEGTLDAYPEWQIPCKVIAIIPTADRQKATVKVRVGFVKLDPRILPDMSAKVAFRASGEVKAAERKITVPQSAIQQHDGRDIVWLVQNGRVARRSVTLGARLGDEVTIAAGLSGGERIVVDAPAGLADGSRVTEEKR
jgi:RND family efflux transporter MFP subunit